MFFEIPLDLGFCSRFTDARSGERTPTGAVRRGLRPSPHRSRGAAESEHGQCSRPPRTGLSDSFGSVDGNDESADVAGNRGGRRVRPGRRRLRAAAETETCWIVRRARGNPQPASGTARQPGTLVAFRAHLGAQVGAEQATESWEGAEGTGATPTGLSESGSWRQDRRLGQPGQREAVPRVRGRETGVESERGIARRAERRDGRCEQVETKANARPSTGGGPVHPSSPGRRAGESPQRRPGRFRFPPPPLDRPNRKMRTGRSSAGRSAHI